jgi:hypothetical protein
MPFAEKAKKATILVQRLMDPGADTELILATLRGLYPDCEFTYPHAHGLHVIVPEPESPEPVIGLPKAVKFSASLIAERRKDGSYRVRKDLCLCALPERAPVRTGQVVGPSVWEWLRHPAV